MYHITAGTVRPMVVSDLEDGTPHFCQHFWLAEYQVGHPVLTEAAKKAARPIVEKMNDGSLPPEDARILIKRL